MSTIAGALRETPKGKLQYSPRYDASKLEMDLNQVSPPPLTHFHEEQELSKVNLSFGLDSSSFDESINNKSKSSLDGFSPFEKKDVKENCNNSGFSLEYNDKSGNNVRSPPVNSLNAANSGRTEAYGKRKEDMLDLSYPVNKLQKTPETAELRHRPVSSCPVSPEFGETMCAILDEEKAWDSTKQLNLLGRWAQFDDHDRALSYLMKGKLEDMEGKLEQMVKDKHSLLEQKQQEGAAEAHKKLQRLREDHLEHQKKIVTKHKEIERKRVLLEMEEKRRQEIEAEKLRQLRGFYQAAEANRQKFAEIHDACSVKSKLSDVVDTCRTKLETMCAALSAQLTAFEEAACVPQEVVKKFEEYSKRCQQAVDVLNKQIEQTEAKSKEEEEKKIEENKKKAEEEKKKEEARKLASEAAQDLSVQSLTYVLKEYENKSKKVQEVEARIQSFITNTEMKKYRFDLQRAVNTPINAISPVSGSHLRDKLQRLHALLSGQPVDVSGKRICAKDVPDGIVFCQNLVAKMLVRKGEEQVTSKHESAFAIAAVVVGMWADFPLVGDLFMGHLQALCPYVLPMYSVRQEGQSNADYHRSLGYKVNEDGTIEEQDKFLRRMSGLMRLYSACLVAIPPRGANSPHPQSLEHAWMWLSRTFNLEPQPDVTAALIHDLLSVTGHALLAEYRTQFAKLLFLLYKFYLPKLKAVAITSATVGRLETFLEKAVKNNGRIPPPEGLLPSNFWQS